MSYEGDGLPLIGCECDEEDFAEMVDAASSNYAKYRGKCKQFSEAAVAADPTLRLAKGWYVCPVWGREEHWWTVRADGSIFDPTKDQYPSRGQGNYEEFAGFYDCAQCGKKVAEADAVADSRYVFCSYECNGKFVGVF